VGEGTLPFLDHGQNLVGRRREEVVEQVIVRKVESRSILMGTTDDSLQGRRRGETVQDVENIGFLRITPPGVGTRGSQFIIVIVYITHWPLFDGRMAVDVGNRERFRSTVDRLGRRNLGVIRRRIP
jgi:hypothetical protein